MQANKIKHHGAAARKDQAQTYDGHQHQRQTLKTQDGNQMQGNIINQHGTAARRAKTYDGHQN